MVVSWRMRVVPQTHLVPQSLILQMPRFGMDVVLAHPPEFKLMPDIVAQAQEQAKKFGTALRSGRYGRGVQGCRYVYAKSWGRC